MMDKNKDGDDPFFFLLKAAAFYGNQDRLQIYIAG